MPRVRKTEPNQAQLFEMPDNAARTARKPPQPLTSAQQLGSIVKSARDIMRKDKGLNRILWNVSRLRMRSCDRFESGYWLTDEQPALSVPLVAG
jgi:hypothetical protein